MTNPQEQFTAAIRTAQTTASEAVQAWASMAQRAVGTMTSTPGASSASPVEFIDQTFDLIERMLEGQRAMAKSMVGSGQKWTEQAQAAGDSLQQRWSSSLEQTAETARQRASSAAAALSAAREQAEAATTAAWERTGTAVEDAVSAARQRTEEVAEAVSAARRRTGEVLEATRDAAEAMTKPAVEAMTTLARRASSNAADAAETAAATDAAETATDTAATDTAGTGGGGTGAAGPEEGKPADRPAPKKRAAPASGGARTRTSTPDFAGMSKAELQAELTRRGLPKSGNVADLRQRLQES